MVNRIRKMETKYLAKITINKNYMNLIVKGRQKIYKERCKKCINNNSRKWSKQNYDYNFRDKNVYFFASGFEPILQ